MPATGITYLGSARTLFSRFSLTSRPAFRDEFVDSVTGFYPSTGDQLLMDRDWIQAKSRRNLLAVVDGRRAEKQASKSNASLVYNQNLPSQSPILLALTLISVSVIGMGLQSILGAGDTKLIATSLLVTADPKLLVSIGILGGVVSLMTLLASKIAQQNKDVPYGVAISAATLLHIWST